MRELEPFEVIVFRMPPRSAAMLTAIAVQNKISRSQLVRDMIERMLPIDDEQIRMPAPRKPASAPTPGPVTAEELFARGIEPNKVAAMLRMPYREVMRAYGEWIDVQLKEKDDGTPG